MNEGIEVVPALFFVGGLVVLILFSFARTLRRSEERDLATPPSLAITTRHVVKALIVTVVAFDVVLASVRILYPRSELKIESSSFADIVKSALWPIAFVMFLVFFRQPLSDFLKGMTKARVKIGDNEVELAKEAAQISAVSASLGAASATASPTADGQPSAPDASGIAKLAAFAVRTLRHADLRETPRVLWVDDRPANNISLRDSFENLGIRVDLALTTDEALTALAQRKYTLIISDMGRPPDMQAGYTLLDKLREKGITMPYIIYAGSNLPEHRTMAIQRGAIASTNSPSEVFRLVTAVVQHDVIAQG